MSKPIIKLVQTCGACPEQYDAFIGENQVGYLRLRHGFFTVEYPNCGGEKIYEARPEGDGNFFDHERDYYLRFAVDAILKHHLGEPVKPIEKPPAPEVEYKIEA